MGDVESNEHNGKRGIWNFSNIQIYDDDRYLYIGNTILDMPKLKTFIESGFFEDFMKEFKSFLEK